MVISMDTHSMVVAITIILTVAGLILAFLKFFRNGDSILSKSNGFVSFPYLKDKLKEFVTKNGCDGTVKGFERILENHQASYREELRMVTDSIRNEIRALVPRIQTTIKDEITNNNK